MKKTLLLISYYWNPDISAGIHRWVRFANQLIERNWKIIVVTAATQKSTSLTKRSGGSIEIIVVPTRDPNILVSKWLRYANPLHNGFLSNTGISNKLKRFLRANLFIPDAKSLWIRPATKQVQEFAKSFAIDLVVSTGPPHSTHLVALEACADLNLPWVADFRDLWTEGENIDSLPFTKWARSRNASLEARVLMRADEVLTVSPAWSSHLQKKTGRTIRCVTSGFPKEPNGDRDTLNEDLFSIGYFGYMDLNRNPDQLWVQLAKLADQYIDFQRDLRLDFYGVIDQKILDQLQVLGLHSNVRYYDYIPHQDALKQMRTTQVLLLTQSKSTLQCGHVPMKFFDYLLTGRPILGIGMPESDCSQMLVEIGGGVFIHAQQPSKIKHRILGYYNQYKASNLRTTYNDGINRFLASEVTNELEKILESPR